MTTSRLVSSRARREDVGVEVHSMSKGWHMIGWRLGFVAGHELIVRAFADVKDNSDSGQFMAIQRAGARRSTMRRSRWPFALSIAAGWRSWLRY